MSPWVGHRWKLALASLVVGVSQGPESAVGVWCGTCRGWSLRPSLTRIWAMTYLYLEWLDLHEYWKQCTFIPCVRLTSILWPFWLGRGRPAVQEEAKGTKSQGFLLLKPCSSRFLSATKIHVTILLRYLLVFMPLHVWYLKVDNSYYPKKVRKFNERLR